MLLFFSMISVKLNLWFLPTIHAFLEKLNWYNYGISFLRTWPSDHDRGMFIQRSELAVGETLNNLTLPYVSNSSVNPAFAHCLVWVIDEEVKFCGFFFETVVCTQDERHIMFNSCTYLLFHLPLALCTGGFMGVRRGHTPSFSVKEKESCIKLHIHNWTNIG